MQVEELSVEHRDRLWRDSDGDDWKFSEGCWRYRRPGAKADEWDSTETDEEPNGYGPFEQVWERFGLSYECDNDNHEIGCQCPGNVSQLQQVRELANCASWQANAETPQKFHQFLVSLLKASGGFEPDNV